MTIVRKVGQVYVKGDGSEGQAWEDVRLNEQTVLGISISASNLLQVGIQAVPGTQFTFDEKNLITIGNTGIYEINFEGFDITVSKLTVYKNNNHDINDYLIIDYIYEEEI